jgi:bifunctional UDP-N-acetylglucosamine pyrophosphorylase/glucosamine-1-phosphate N-acetyltransferase
MIGAGSVVGFASEVARSWVGEKCWFHRNYVGDSVLEGRVAMGAGAVTANLRLDEGEVESVVKGKKTATGRVKLGLMSGAGVKIGVNSAVMPGVKIGGGSFLGPGTVLREDIPDGKAVFVEQKHVVKKNRVSSPEEGREGSKSS